MTRERVREENDLQEERAWAERGLEGVCLVEGDGDGEFVWVMKTEDEKEVLEWNGGEGEWGGWVMREKGVDGHPQLFWVRKGFELPREGGWRKIELTREFL